MFKNPFQVAVSFAVIALIVKITIFSLNMQHGDMGKYLPYMYMFILLTAVFFGIRSNKIVYEGNTSFGQDFKSGARTAAFFALLVAAITYVYYAKIDTDFFITKKSEYLALYETTIDELIKEKGLETAKKDALNKIIGLNTIYSPFSQASYTLLGLVFMGMFNSLVFAFMMNKFPGFKQ
ncbi:MAG: DUF4199 domain-containing protein [Vicingus serpentipes]|nr:DUF4199 domain-containing protein [Vicingus serpentipes]